MTSKNRFFNFFKSNNEVEYAGEEKLQRDYALAKKQEEKVKEKPKVHNIDESDQPVDQQIVDFSKETLEKILTLANFKPEVKIDGAYNEEIFISIHDEENRGRIIGREGATLKALQTVLRGMVYTKFTQHLLIMVDLGDYRQKKIERLQQDAEKYANQVKESNRSLKLSPMNASDRRIIHVYLKQNNDVHSLSEGTGTNRHIIIMPNDSN